MCLSLRDEHGHFARVVTNYDGDVTGRTRRRVTQAVASRWAAAGSSSAAEIGLDAPGLLATVAEQPANERSPQSILDVTAATEAATELAFRQTAVVAGRPDNADALADAGRFFGRLAHLLDAVEDLHADRAAVRALCDDAVLGVELALRDVVLVDGRLVHALLVDEARKAVRRTFVGAGQPPGPPHQPPLTPPLPPEQQPPDGEPVPDEVPTGWEIPDAGDQPPPKKQAKSGCSECCDCCECFVCCSCLDGC
jgi:hypothetical protein